MYKSKAKVCRRFTWSSELVVWAAASFSLVSGVVLWIESSSEALLLTVAEVDWLAEALTTWDALKETDWESELLSESNWLTDFESDSDSLADWLADTESVIEVVPKTKLSEPATPVDGLISDPTVVFIPFSSANTGLATVVAPARAPSTTIPLTRSAGIECDVASYWTTIFSSTPPRMTRNRPNRETDARTQFFPDLINLKRVIRSVSRKSPFERLKNMSAP